MLVQISFDLNSFLKKIAKKSRRNLKIYRGQPLI
jgi:hypothetical protein